MATREGPHLIIEYQIENELHTFVCALDKPVTTIGREKSNDIVIPVESVSRRHAQIIRNSREPERVKFEDVGSTNGSYLSNGHRIIEPIHIQTGHKVELGKQVFLTYQNGAYRKSTAPLTFKSDADTEIR